MEHKVANQPLSFLKFRVWEVVVPVRDEIIAAPPSPGVLYKDNIRWPDIPIYLVEGETTEGFVAVGECDRGTPRAVVEATLRDLLGRDLRTLAPAAVWMTPLDPVGLPQSYPLWSWQASPDKSYLLLESLWADAVGKAAGMPAHLLFGGAVRRAVTTDFWANRPDAVTLAALVREAGDRGLRGMKMKSDSGGDTVHSLLAIAQDVPADFRFTIDPMLAWRSLRQSARLLDALAQLPFTIQIEDPFPYTALEDWRQARDFQPLTIVCHARDEDVLRLALREELADAFNLGGSGGYEFLQKARVAEFYAKDCWHGSSLELGVLQHLRLHAAACARNCLLASDLQSEWLREHTLVTPRMQYHDGAALLSDRPGLGVELDHAAIPQYCRSHFEVA
jgi:muconate cycloisomerase